MQHIENKGKLKKREDNSVFELVFRDFITTNVNKIVFSLKEQSKGVD